MKKTFMYNPNTRIPARLAGNMGTKENTEGIKKVQMYQIFITDKTLGVSRKISGRESGRK